MPEDQQPNIAAEGKDRSVDAGYAPRAKIGPDNVPSGIYSPPPEPPQSQPSGDSSPTSTDN